MSQKASKGSARCSGTAGFVSGEHSPQGITEFDYRGLDPCMDEEDAGKAAVREGLQRVLQAVCEWLYPARCRDESVGLRAWAFLWFLRPDWLGNPSQVELGERLGVSKQVMGKVINKLRRKFGFYVAGMRGDEARRKFARHAKEHAGELAEARRKAAARKARAR